MLQTAELGLYFSGLSNDASLSKSAERRTIGWLMKDKLERFWQEEVDLSQVLSPRVNSGTE